MYCFWETVFERWDERQGLISIGIDNMVESFLSKLTCRDSVPLDLLIITYIAIAQGGLGLMDAHTRAVPDFVLTMSQAIWYAEKGPSFSKTEPMYHLPTTLCDLFCLRTNDTSGLLRPFYRLLPDLALVGTHIKCTDPVAFFLKHGSFNSARDIIKKEASK